MPFTPSSAPPDVRRRFTGHCLEVWCDVFNDTLMRHGDEGRAFATAETAGQKCNQSRKAEDDTVDMAVKFAKDSDVEIRGLAIPFGGPLKGRDIDGEAFGPDTDLCLDWFPHGRPLLYHHGLNGAVKTAVVGRQTVVEPDDEGMWVTGELDKRSRYYSRVKRLIEEGAVSFSSGAMQHLVRTRKDGHIETWPWVELSLTPTPAHPGAVVYAVKSAPMDFITDDESDDPGSGSFDEHAARVASDVGALLDRAGTRVDLRATKVGRELSASNRHLLMALAETIRELLERTDPEAKQRAAEDKATETKALEADYLRVMGRLAGVTQQ